jgi:hypothetical protein
VAVQFTEETPGRPKLLPPIKPLEKVAQRLCRVKQKKRPAEAGRTSKGDLALFLSYRRGVPPRQFLDQRL